MFKYVTDLLFSEEKEEEDVYDEHDEEADDDSTEDPSVSASDSEDASGEEEDQSDSDEEASDSDAEKDGENGGGDQITESTDNRCILSCDDLTILQQFVDSIREECASRGIAIGGSRCVIRGTKRKAQELSAEESLAAVCDTVPGIGCDPQDPIPCECTKPKEE